jgi:hypothetical protein
MKLCVTVEGSPRVNALTSSSSSTWPEMSHKSNPVSLLLHHVKCILKQQYNVYLLAYYLNAVIFSQEISHARTDLAPNPYCGADVMGDMAINGTHRCIIHHINP